MAEQRGGRPISGSMRPTGGDKAMAGKKQYFRRKKVCRFCVDKIDDINYKDTRLLSSFISERGKITPRRISGVCTPHQKRLKIHRAQGFYLWLLYGFLAIKWHFFDDFYQIAVAKIGEHKIPRPRGKDLAVFIGGKVAFFSMALMSEAFR